MTQKNHNFKPLCGQPPSRKDLKHLYSVQTSCIMPVWMKISIINEPVHEIPNNVVCATSKASNQPAFASRLSIL